MLIFGGLNSKKNYLNDLLYLDLKELRWYHKDYKVEGKELGEFMEEGLAKHSAVSVFKSRKNYPLYSPEYSEEEGIYFFGGENGKG